MNQIKIAFCIDASFVKKCYTPHRVHKEHHHSHRRQGRRMIRTIQTLTVTQQRHHRRPHPRCQLMWKGDVPRIIVMMRLVTKRLNELIRAPLKTLLRMMAMYKLKTCQM